MFAGTPEELAAHEAQIRVIAEQVASRLNEMAGLGSAVAVGGGRIVCDAGAIRFDGRRWTLTTGR